MKKSFLLTLNCHTIYMYIIEIHLEKSFKFRIIQQKQLKLNGKQLINLIHYFDDSKSLSTFNNKKKIKQKNKDKSCFQP